jgi:hypothetical protein
MLHMIAEGHILKIVQVNVTWWKKTASHYQALQNVCVNSQNCLSTCYLVVEEDSCSLSSSPKCLCKCHIVTKGHILKFSQLFM